MANLERELSRFCREGKFSQNLYRSLSQLFQRVVGKELDQSHRTSPMQMVEDFLQDFYTKLQKICEKFLNGIVQNIEAYLYQSVCNFVLKQYERLRPNDVKIDSLNVPVESLEEESEYVELIPAETKDPFFEILVEDFFNLFLKECSESRARLDRHVCFLLWRDYYGEEKFVDPSWSEPHKYKIRERTRKFIEKFMEEYSVEEKVMGAVLLKFLSDVCEKMDH